MTRGLPARGAVVCAILAMAQVNVALGQPRTVVAVVDVTGEPAAGALADELYRELFNHPDLSPLDQPVLVAKLSGALDDPDAAWLARGRDARSRAAELITGFEYKAAEQAALSGQRDLLALTPDSDHGLFAELAIQAGVAALWDHRANDAHRAFALAHRLDPMRQLDPASYQPQFVTAYQLASSNAGAPVKLEIKGTGHVWLDGIERGEAPGTFDVEPGPHVVQLVGLERQTRGDIATAPGTVTIPDAPYSEQQNVMRARLALARAPDPAARAVAMQRLAQLLGVHDAVLISKSPEGKLLVQTWRDRAPGLSGVVEVEHASERPAEVLAPLVPPKPPEPPRVVVPPIGPPPHREDQPPWYRNRWVQASAAVGVLGAVMGAVLWARRTHDLMIDPNIQSK